MSSYITISSQITGLVEVENEVAVEVLHIKKEEQVVLLINEKSDCDEAKKV